ncbi:MAG: hypothetical protein AAGH19_09255 [Pseudomonadota bacterium]
MKTILLSSILTVLVTSTASAQTLVGPAERLWQIGDSIDGELVTFIREGSVDEMDNVASFITANDEDSVIIATVDGVPTIIIREGDAIPGGGFVESFSEHTGRLGDLVLYHGSRIDDDPTNRSGDEALLLQDVNVSVPTVIARTGVTLVPGRTVSFESISTTQGFGLGGGRVAFSASFVDGVDGRGVYLWENGAMSTIADTDDSFGGLPFTRFDNAKPDENGSGIVFDASRDDAGTSVRSVFVAEGGSLTELISTGDPFPGSSGMISRVGRPDIDGGRVVVRLEGSAGEDGVFIVDTQGNTTLVADLNTPLPDSAGDTGPATRFQDQVGIGGNLVFFRAARPVAGLATWIWGNGTFEPVLPSGEILDGREVDEVSGNVERHSMSRNALVVEVLFDGSADGIYRIPLSQPVIDPPPVTPPPGPSSVQPVPLPGVAAVLAVLLLLFGGRALRARQHA